jgi:hypothetical protein
VISNVRGAPADRWRTSGYLRSSVSAPWPAASTSSYLRDAFPQGRVTLPDHQPVDLTTLTTDPNDEQCARSPSRSHPSRSSFARRASSRRARYPPRPGRQRRRLPRPLCDVQPDLFLAIAEDQARAWRGPLHELLDA